MKRLHSVVLCPLTGDCKRKQAAEVYVRKASGYVGEAVQA